MQTRDQVVPTLREYRYTPRSAKLTRVQWIISQLIACGLADKEIAYILGVATSTVKAHNNSTMRALGLIRRGQLIRYIFEAGEFSPEKVEELLVQNRGKRNDVTAVTPLA
jgi:DNA-binding NarL/FixJ family response regulator